MAPDSFRFDRFVLDPHDRQLRRDGVPVDLNSRYLDALALLVREDGKLVSKDRFLDEVWKGIPVTDEALTQCIRTLRRQLGDDAASPRFIETVPKHGYRFVAAVDRVESDQQPRAAPLPAWRRLMLLGAAGTAGGAVAGLLGGLFYGFAAAAMPLAPGTGATSVLLVLVAMTTLIASIGAAGVAFGIAAAGLAAGGPFGRWSIAGGAAGGLLVGAFVKLLGLDAFDLLFGRSPREITGAAEGLVLGAAAGLGAWRAMRGAAALSLRRGVVLAALAGGAAGMLIALLGGRLMGGSLDLLADTFPGSRLEFGRLGALFGEDGFGTVTRVTTGTFEGALFAGCVVGAMILARRMQRPGN